MLMTLLLALSIQTGMNSDTYQAMAHQLSKCTVLLKILSNQDGSIRDTYKLDLMNLSETGTP
jgi:hypothetical protein